MVNSCRVENLFVHYYSTVHSTGLRERESECPLLHKSDNMVLDLVIAVSKRIWVTMPLHSTPASSQALADATLKPVTFAFYNKHLMDVS